MSNDLSPADASEEVSGQAAFWILITLATAAIVQPSGRSKRRNRDAFDGNIDLLRSLPAVCFLDAIADLVGIGNAIHRALSTSEQTQNTRRRILPRASTLIVKVALFVVTILPQTIKVASLKGVPGTQACAFIFFIAAMIRLVVDLCGLEINANYTNARDEKLSATIPAMGALFLQLPFELWIWYNISLSTTFTLSTASEDISAWIAIICTAVLLIQPFIWLSYLVIRRRFDTSASPYMVPMLGLYLLLVALGAATKPVMPKDSDATSKPPPSWSHHIRYTLNLMTCTALISIAVAKLIDTLVRLVPSGPDYEEDNMSTTDRHSAASVEGPEPEPEPQDIADMGHHNFDQPEEIRQAHAPKKHRDDKDSKREFRPRATGGLSSTWLGKFGILVDRWLLRALTVHSIAGITFSLTIFNLLTTILYYLVYFNGTDTVNPDWTSILG